MGRIKTKLVKRKTKELLNAVGECVNDKFDSNKEVVANSMEYKSKKMRNIVAGYATRLKKAEESL